MPFLRLLSATKTLRKNVMIHRRKRGERREKPLLKNAKYLFVLFHILHFAFTSKWHTGKYLFGIV
jgi:hypothetical protein